MSRCRRRNTKEERTVLMLAVVSRHTVASSGCTMTKSNQSSNLFRGDIYWTIELSAIRTALYTFANWSDYGALSAFILTVRVLTMNRSLHWIPRIIWSTIRCLLALRERFNLDRTMKNDVWSTHLHPHRIQWTFGINNKQNFFFADLNGLSGITNTYEFWAYCVLYLAEKGICWIPCCTHSFGSCWRRLGNLQFFSCRSPLVYRGL